MGVQLLKCRSQRAERQLELGLGFYQEHEVKIRGIQEGWTSLSRSCVEKGVQLGRGCYLGVKAT